MKAGDVEDIYELSPLQQGILFHSLYESDSDVYVNQRSFIIEGALEADALITAWTQSVAAHPSLRTSFHWDDLDKPLQVVHRDVPTVVSRYDWSETADQEASFTQLMADDLAAGFDLARPPLQRLHLIRFPERRYGLIWSHHLLVLDGWSVPIFITDVMLRYQSLIGGGPPPPPGPSYRDYIAWLQRQNLDEAKHFWREALAGWAGGSPIAPMLPADPAGGVGPLEERVADVPPAVEAGLRAMAARNRVTMNTVLHGAWALVLQRYSGMADVTFGCTSSARPPEVPGAARMTGLFTNSLPVRVSVPQDGDLGSWLREVQARYTAVRRYQYSPLAQITQWAGIPGHQKLFESLLIFDNYPLAVEFGDPAGRLHVRSIDAIEKTSQPLVLIAGLEPRFSLSIRFHRRRFAPGSAEEIFGCFQASLAAMAGTDRIADVAAALEQRPRPQPKAVQYPDARATLPELIERQARTMHGATAVIADDGRLGYRELMKRARRVADALGAAGTGPGDVVGICAERSLDMVAGLVGVLLAGAAYLPLDPSQPVARLAFMTGDAGADVVLATRATAGLAREAGARRVLLLDDLPPGGSGRSRLPAPRGTDAAYVLYTSGSTGRPKGVVITHEAIVNRLLWMQDTFRLAASDRVLQKTPVGFDVSVWELFLPLLAGATLVLARPGGFQDAEYLATTIARQAITTAHFVPVMLALFLEEPAAAELPELQRVICSGEQLTYPLALRFRELLPHAELHNLYGPTEAAVDVTWWDCARPGVPGMIPIGDPIANTQCYVLDGRLVRAPRGVPGELYLGGIQLARGYVGRPGLTAATFVAHPLAGPGGRLYRTGDLVRELPDGSLEFLGRIDHQVKIHGYRIEPGEVEQALLRHPAVREAAVVARQRADGYVLDAYVTLGGDQPADPQVLRDHLRSELPPYMIPATITVLPAVPLTHNGKLDRAALPDPTPAITVSQEAGPAAPHEEPIAAVYRDVLGLAEVDVTASFFDLGGNSFDAVRAVRRIEGASVGLLGAHPSVRDLAAALARPQTAEQMLLRLTDPAAPAAHTLVCVPFGGGSAITYQPLAQALPKDIALFAAVLPGHEIGGPAALRPVEQVAQECADAVIEAAAGPVSVYGHCAGVALAIEIVRRLEAAHTPVTRLYLAGSYPFYEPARLGRAVQGVINTLVRAHVLPVSSVTVGLGSGTGSRLDKAEMRYLQSLGGFGGVVTDEDLAFMMRAFRHDVADAARYFSRRWPPRGVVMPLAVPITFIAGTEDPMTQQYQLWFRAWERFGAGVELVTVPGGRHYFHQHQAGQVAEIISGRCALPAPAARLAGWVDR